MSQSGRNAAALAGQPKIGAVGGMPSKIHVILWKWNQEGFMHKYLSEHVNIVCDMIARHKGQMPLRILNVTDDPKGVTECETFPLWGDHDKLANRSGARLPSCYRRLKLFDGKTQEAMGIFPGERIISLDLDTVIAGELTSSWCKPHHFVGWAQRGVHHLRVFNGSMWAFTAGTHQEMWDNFDPLTTPDRCHKAGYLGSDQSWLSYNFAKDPTCGTWTYPAAVSYPKEVARRPQLSKGTSVVFYHGKRKPWDAYVQDESPWIRQHWKRGEQGKPPPLSAGTMKPVQRQPAVVRA